MQDNCGYETGHLLLEACNGDTDKVLSIVRKFKRDEKLKAFYNALDICLRIEKEAKESDEIVG